MALAHVSTIKQINLGNTVLYWSQSWFDPKADTPLRHTADVSRDSTHESCCYTLAKKIFSFSITFLRWTTLMFIPLEQTSSQNALRPRAWYENVLETVQPLIRTRNLRCTRRRHYFALGMNFCSEERGGSSVLASATPGRATSAESNISGTFPQQVRTPEEIII